MTTTTTPTTNNINNNNTKQTNNEYILARKLASKIQIETRNNYIYDLQLQEINLKLARHHEIRQLFVQQRMKSIPITVPQSLLTPIQPPIPPKLSPQQLKNHPELQKIISPPQYLDHIKSTSTSVSVRYKSTAEFDNNAIQVKYNVQLLNNDDSTYNTIHIGSEHQIKINKLPEGDIIQIRVRSEIWLSESGKRGANPDFIDNIVNYARTLKLTNTTIPPQQTMGGAPLLTGRWGYINLSALPPPPTNLQIIGTYYKDALRGIIKLQWIPWIPPSLSSSNRRIRVILEIHDNQNDDEWKIIHSSISSTKQNTFEVVGLESKHEYAFRICSVQLYLTNKGTTEKIIGNYSDIVLGTTSDIITSTSSPSLLPPIHHQPYQKRYTDLATLAFSLALEVENRTQTIQKSFRPIFDLNEMRWYYFDQLTGLASWASETIPIPSHAISLDGDINIYIMGEVLRTSVQAIYKNNTPEWIECWDSKWKRNFFYNLNLGICTWDEMF